MADVITTQELKALMSSDRQPAVFDVRRKADFEDAPKKIERAAWCDPEKVNEWINEIPHDKPVIVYCAKGGSVSQSIADRIQQTHPDVKFLQGGIKAWKELDGPIEE
ncbi:MAG: sulfurtransferase [Deltaproteobacteria bacterium]|nr:sulfurtransferase [Deltaproteobacteria bacterium]MBF0527110.1 sulfurtransferase [Deltaproteobacteria bacterium]